VHALQARVGGDLMPTRETATHSKAPFVLDSDGDVVSTTSTGHLQRHASVKALVDHIDGSGA
jgi:hypothetical protein